MLELKGYIYILTHIHTKKKKKKSFIYSSILDNAASF